MKRVQHKKAKLSLSSLKKRIKLLSSLYDDIVNERDALEEELIDLNLEIGNLAKQIEEREAEEEGFVG